MKVLQKRQNQSEMECTSSIFWYHLFVNHIDFKEFVNLINFLRLSLWNVFHKVTGNIVEAVDHEIVTQATVHVGPVCSVLVGLFGVKVIAKRWIVVR